MHRRIQMHTVLLRPALFLFVCTSLFALPCQCELYQNGLFQDILDRDGSQHSIIERPVDLDNETVPVTMGFNLQQIIALDVKEQYLLSSMTINLTWKDVSLRWNPRKHGNISTIRLPIKLMWRPDILLYNTADDKYDATWPVNAIVRSDGTVTYLPPAMLKSTCNVDVQWFPFDEQRCMLKFGSWTYHDREVNLTLKDDPVSKNDDMTNGEFDIEYLAAKRFDKIYVYGEGYAENFPYVALCIHLKRRDLYYFFNLIVPSILIMAVATLVFVLPAESEEKMGLSVTVLLSLTVYSTVLAESLPRTSEAVPLLGYYCQIMMTLCAGAVCSQVWSLHLHHSDSTSPWMHWVCVHLAKYVGLRTPQNILVPQESNYTQTDSKRNSKDVIKVFRNLDTETELTVMQIASDTALLAHFASVESDCDQNDNHKANDLNESEIQMDDDQLRQQLCTQMQDVTLKLEELADRIRHKNSNDVEGAICCFASAVIDRLCLYIYLLLSLLLVGIICFWRPETAETVPGEWNCPNDIGGEQN